MLVSLVRNNKDNDIGFVANRQRINVLLSRARDGLYLFGNAACLRAGSKPKDGSAERGAWDIALDLVRVRSGVPVCCQAHGTQQLVRSAEDFQRLAPAGGCAAPCAAKLPCGHACTAACHPPGAPHAACRETVPDRCVVLHCVLFSPTDEDACAVRTCSSPRTPTW